MEGNSGLPPADTPTNMRSHRSAGAVMYRNILVPIDGSAPSLRGLHEAIKFSQVTGASVKLIHVVHEVILDAAYVTSLPQEQLIVTLRAGGRKILAQAEALAREHNVAVETELVQTIGARAADAIIERAKQWPADLIVMGTHGRRGLRRLAMGSDAEMVLRSSPVPVLMVRASPEAA